VAPEQILLEAGCADFRDERAHSAIAEAAERVLREGYESTNDVHDWLFFVCLCLHSVSCLLGAYTDFLSGGLFTWRAVLLSSLRGRIDFFSLPDGLRHLFRDHNP